MASPDQQIPNLVYVLFTAEINPNTVETLMQAMSNLAQQKVRDVYLVISTPGGQVTAGIALYNFLRSVPFNLTAHNIGNVDSIGNAIFLAADRRVACPNATFMFHGVGFDQQAGRYEEKPLREMLDGILSDQKRIGDIIVDRTSIKQDQVEGFFREAQTKTAEFARQWGIVHDVAEFQLPAGVPVISFVFERQRI